MSQVKIYVYRDVGPSSWGERVMNRLCGTLFEASVQPYPSIATSAYGYTARSAERKLRRKLVSEARAKARYESERGAMPPYGMLLIRESTIQQPCGGESR